MNHRRVTQFLASIIIAYCSFAHAALKIKTVAQRLAASARLHTAARLHLAPVVQGTKVLQTAPELPDKYVPHYEFQKKQYYKELAAKPWASVAQAHSAQFEKRDAQIKQSFKQYANDQQYDEQYHRLVFQATIMQRNMTLLKISAERAYACKIAPVVVNGIRHVLQDTQCDTTPIAIVPNEHVASMGTDHSTIYVGKQLLHAPAILALRGFNLERIKAMALHEVQYLLHDDAFDRAFYNHLFPLEAELRQRLHTLQEERADILSGLSSPEYARALAGYHKACASPWDRIRLRTTGNKALFKNQESFYGEAHPLVRAQRLEALAEEMKAMLQGR